MHDQFPGKCGDSFHSKSCYTHIYGEVGLKAEILTYPAHQQVYSQVECYRGIYIVRTCIVLASRRRWGRLIGRRSQVGEYRCGGVPGTWRPVGRGLGGWCVWTV